MKRHLKILFASTLLVLFTITYVVNLSAGTGDQNDKHPEVDFTLSCRSCHQDITPDIHKAWKESAHGRMNYSCYLCHGDGQQEFHTQPQTQTCIGCHSGQEVDFTKTKADNCFDCHQGHSLKFHEKE